MRDRLILLIALFSLTLFGVHQATNQRESEIKHPEWGAVPYSFDDWHGTDAAFDPVYGSDPADSTLFRFYTKGDQPPVIVYVGFYSDLSAILDVHTPELCYPAQGWRISAVQRVQLGFFRDARIPAKEMIAEKYDAKRLVMWWYLSGSKPIDTRIRYVYAMLLLSSFTGRTDGSMVRLETPLDATGEPAAQARIQEFEASFVTSLEKALP